MEKKKRRRGDRKDGTWVRDADTMHAFLPFLMPNRADNEALLNETIDLTPINEYIAKKNETETEFKYTFFHVICAALGKTIALRPKMNRFYTGDRLYQRNDISFSFVVKRQFVDDGAEALALIKLDEDSDISPIEQIHSKIKSYVFEVRKEQKSDGTTDKMGILNKLPRPVLRLTMRILRALEYHGHYPDVLMMDDPYYCSVFISNLGSIKMHANYHHLANWGTNSIFVIIGEKKMTPFYKENGEVEMRETLELGMTIDERIADGLYFANTIKMLKKILANPEILEQTTETPVEI